MRETATRSQPDCGPYSKPATNLRSFAEMMRTRRRSRRTAPKTLRGMHGKPRIAFIGFGEAGQAIAAGLHDADAAEMTAWDILFPQSVGNKLRRAADASGVRCAASAADAVRQAELVISAVKMLTQLHATLTSPYWRRSIRRVIRHLCLLPGRTAKPSRRRSPPLACAPASPAPRLAPRQRSKWCAA